MEDQLVQILANTQVSAEGPRKQAEVELKQARSNPAFPLSLANIGSHNSVSVEIRQAALSQLRLFIEQNWSGESDDGPVVPIADVVKDQVRTVTLELAVNTEDRKIKRSASYAVGKIANVDFPEQWPSLLPTLLGVIPTGTDSQLHGALKVLSDLVDETLSDDQFFSMARDIVKVVYQVALEGSRKPILRALAIDVFRGCFNLMETVKEEHPEEVTGFASEALKGWFPFFLQILKEPFPDRDPTDPSQPSSWNGITALKLQVVKCLLRVKQVFASLLLPETPHFFQAVWQELSLLEPAYEQLYIDNAAQGRLEDADNLPYTLDLLILEELGFLKDCMKAPPVRKELEGQLQAHASAHETPWVLDIMKLSTSYARVTQEEEEMWDIDPTLFIAEEAFVSANYTPRIAAGDLVIKVGEWLGQGALEGLFAYTKNIFAGEASWRWQEAALFLPNRMVGDFIECNKSVHPDITQAYMELVNYAVSKPDTPLLRGRGYLTASVLVRCSAPAVGIMEQTVNAINSDQSELVQVACIKAIEGHIQPGPTGETPGPEIQVKVIQAINQWVAAKDMTEMEDAGDLLVSLAETLRTAIDLDKRITTASDSPALDLLFLIAKHGADNYNVTVLVCETFEDIVQDMSDPASYQAICAKILPSLTGAFDVAKVTADDQLLVVACELMTSLTQYGSEPLPSGFVGAVLPKLNKLLMESDDGEILRPGSESVRYLLAHDHEQMFNYSDENGRGGLEVCLHIIDRLLGAGIEDNAASEVGGLAAELVEKAGHERLGPYLPQLLQAVANRLTTAYTAPFIQSLIIVFARLSLVGAADVVEFLSTFQINGQPALQMVLSKWLENSVTFAGYDEIRQNVIALSKLYQLNDPRVEQTMVKGDLIITGSDKILTRSRSKQTPDQYTIVPAPLKILKVLIEELSAASGAQASTMAAAAAAAEFADDDGDDDGWEDDPDVIDLNLGSTKRDLLGYFDGGGGTRHRDDETQTFLVDFFVVAARDNVAKFSEWYNSFTQEEKEELSQMANQQQQ